MYISKEETEAGGKVHWQFRERLLNAKKLKLTGIGEKFGFFSDFGGNSLFLGKK